MASAAARPAAIWSWPGWPNTTPAISVYRKLGVSSRTAALERASELGLIDAGNGTPRFARTA
jgi:hypothetical protein